MRNNRLSLEQLEEITNLLNAGYKPTEVFHKTGRSVGTIYKVYRGIHNLPQYIPPKRGASGIRGLGPREQEIVQENFRLKQEIAKFRNQIFSLHSENNILIQKLAEMRKSPLEIEAIEVRLHREALMQMKER